MTVSETHGTARLIAIAPQFLVNDLELSIAYYRDRLGFALNFKYESFYASVGRDGLAIHLRHGAKMTSEFEKRREDEHLDAYVNVTGAEALYREVQARGARIIKPLGERPWACVDFYVEDADSYVLCFSEAVAHQARDSAASSSAATMEPASRT